MLPNNVPVPFNPSPNRTATHRFLTPTDVQTIFEIRSHPEVMRYWSSPPITEKTQAQAIITSSQEGYASGEYLQLGIARRVDGALIGTCTLFAFHHPSRRAEIGYALGRPYWGQGFMNEALNSFVHYAFDALKLNRLEADIDPRNNASAKTLERLGFVREGYLRERWIVEGEVSDTALYGLLQKEWAKNF
ncbi:MAG: GNAT family N-acetyltransferase [Anaerolineae bacterium]|nr:GNAT family N-acetyltransferase [Anaerolineae bacterium]